MFCKNCGKEIDNNVVSCPYCNEYITPVNNPTNPPDSGSTGWGFLGCCIPLAGLVLYLTWKDTKPLCAKKAGIGAAIGFVAYILISIILFIFMVYFIAATGYYYY